MRVEKAKRSNEHESLLFSLNQYDQKERMKKEEMMKKVNENLNSYDQDLRQKKGRRHKE